MIRNHVAGHFYQLEAMERFFWYPETYAPGIGWGHWTPTLWADGVDDATLAADVDSVWSRYTELISSRLPVPSPLAMDFQVEYGAKADTGTIHVEVVATDPISFNDLHLRLAIIESNIDFGGSIYDQVLRDYFPDTLGVSFSISEGDTFTHSEDFVIQTDWEVENCKIVAFVQDDPTYEVLQSVQGPVITPLPERVADLTVTLAKEDLVLEWSAVTVDTHGHPLEVDLYRIYRDTEAFFDPGSEPFDSTVALFYVDTSGVVGDIPGPITSMR